MDKKKEWKEKFKQMKPDMGIYAIQSKVNNRCYIEATQNLKGAINGARFKLNAGVHPNRELQREWKEFGEDQFIIEILENLEYEEDDSRTDYKEDLALLQMIWEERLSKEGREFYKK